MHESLTPGAARAIERALARALDRQSSRVEPLDWLAAMLDEPESRATALLAEFGLDASRLQLVFGLPSLTELDYQPAADGGESLPDFGNLTHSSSCRQALQDASLIARAYDRGRAVGTEHLLAGLLALEGEIDALLDQLAIDSQSLRSRLAVETQSEMGPIVLEPDTPLPQLTEPGEGVQLSRVLDASANRAREGLRVVEDYVRFALDDPMLTRRIKDVRHRLATSLMGLDQERLLSARDTPGDVGTHIMTANESTRENPRAVLVANFKRCEEALRSLEEYSKLVNVWLAGQFEILRYDVYTLEKLTLIAMASRRLLGDARLYVLVGGQPTLGDLIWIVGEALQGGAQVIQLREKDLTDREWLQRAREVRILTAQARALFIVNDRPDLARLAGADGVHLGQDDLSIRDARRIVGQNTTIGVSTHDPAQFDKSVLDGAGYVAAGPVFASTTKSFHHEQLVGLGLVRHAAECSTLPWFAIGGITERNLPELVEAGARRIAVSSAVVYADQPKEAAKALRAILDEAWSSE